MTKDPLLLRLRGYVAASDLTGNGHSQICCDVKAAADEIEKLRATLEPFAKVADRREMEPSVCDDTMTVTVALINGNVAQSVLHWVLKAGDFRRAKSLIKRAEAA